MVKKRWRPVWFFIPPWHISIDACHTGSPLLSVGRSSTSASTVSPGPAGGALCGILIPRRIPSDGDAERSPLSGAFERDRRAWLLGMGERDRLLDAALCSGDRDRRLGDGAGRRCVGGSVAGGDRCLLDGDRCLLDGDRCLLDRDRCLLDGDRCLLASAAAPFAVPAFSSFSFARLASAALALAVMASSSFRAATLASFNSASKSDETEKFSSAFSSDSPVLCATPSATRSCASAAFHSALATSKRSAAASRSSLVASLSFSAFWACRRAASASPFARDDFFWADASSSSASSSRF
mmetsp:Transcript_77454/g.219019  ORF Transcript_77454/g.219019 Transcript_77454/m.219019 type:complete len:296 (-) Transcript_77454:250-1137(-)